MSNEPDDAERDEVEKRRSVMGRGIGVGVAIGTALGVALDSIGMGIALGVAIGKSREAKLS